MGDSNAPGWTSSATDMLFLRVNVKEPGGIVDYIKYIAGT